MAAGWHAKPRVTWALIIGVAVNLVLVGAMYGQVITRVDRNERDLRLSIAEIRRVTALDERIAGLSAELERTRTEMRLLRTEILAELRELRRTRLRPTYDGEP